MGDSYINPSGLGAIRTWVLSKLSGKVDTDAAATDSTLGLVKTNTTESITLNSSGQLTVGGRLGQYPSGGVFYPTDIEPSGVGTSSFLITDGAKNINAASRTFAIMAGVNITCKSATAGSTQYRVSNTQGNRFICAAVKDGRLALNQTDAIQNGTALITSIEYNDGGDVAATFGATEAKNDIVITVDRTVNPSAATTTLRAYGTNSNGDNILVGQGVGGSGDKGMSLGQSTFIGGNQTLAFGNSVHVMANNSAGFGHTNLVNKQFCLVSGQGHDTTNGKNGVAAFGLWSDIGPTTALAVGNGTAYDARKNIFEVVDNSGQTVVRLMSPSGTVHELYVTNMGVLNPDLIPDLNASIITSGTLPIDRGGTGAATATANRVFAAPNGSDGAPSFRALVAADIPNLAASKITSGTLDTARIPDLAASKITSGTLARARGGTQVDNTAITPNRVFAGPSSGTDTGNATFRALVAADIPNLNASKITAGTLPITRGGTGSTEVTTTTTVSDIVSAASDTTISAARYSVWGKVVTLSVTFTRTSAWNANAQVNVGTVVSGKRPTTQAAGGSAACTAGISTGGVIYARNTTGASVASGTSTTLAFTYLLS